MPAFDEVDQVARGTGFSGVVRVDRRDEVLLSQAYGLADRRFDVPMTPSTRLAVASGSKAMTALVVMRLVEDGRLSLATTARSLLGDDLPLVAEDVTVEHLLSHRSGIGDYLDDDADASAYLMPVSVHRLDTTEAFLPVLDGYPTVFPAGERFSYCNGGFVLLALLAERVTGVGYHELVRRTVCRPAGLTSTDFLRSDDLPGDAATGYVEVGGAWRTNVFHLPVLGTGDGGIYTTAEDVHRFWTALFAGRIVSPSTLSEMLRARHTSEEDGEAYGLGFWLHPTGGGVTLVGGDAGVSFRTDHDPADGLTRTVISNASDGAWPVARALRET